MTQRRAVNKMGKIQSKYPALFTRDTVTVDSSRVDSVVILDTIIVPGSRLETSAITALGELLDSLTVENATLKVKLKTTSNKETNTTTWELTGEAKQDTVYRTVKVPVRQVVYKRVPAAPCEVVKGAPWWYYALFALGGAFFTFLGLKREGVAGLVKGFLKG